MRAHFRTLDEVSDAFSYAQAVELVEHVVYDNELESYAREMASLEARVRDQDMGDECHDLMLPYRRLRYRAATIPLPLNVICEATTTDELQGHVEHFFRRYKEFGPGLSRLGAKYRALVNRDDSPLLTALLQCLTGWNAYSVGVLCKLESLAQELERCLYRHGFTNVEVLSTSQLRHLCFYDMLVVPGPHQWYPSSVVYSPRAPLILSLQTSWLKDRLSEGVVFDSGAPTVVKVSRVEHPSRFGSQDNETVFLQDPLEVLPSVQREVSRLSLPRGTNDIEVAARRYSLAGSHSVFLDEGSFQVLSIDDEVTVEKVQRSEIQLGSYLVLRTGSSSAEFLADIADSIMGRGTARALRELQNGWRVALGRRIRQSGYDAVIAELLKRGSQVSYHSLRAWVSGVVLGPQRIEELRNVINLVGVAETAERCWDALREIRSAHVKAGHHILRELKAVVEMTDRERIEQTGRFDFIIDEYEGGALTAFRVEHIDLEAVSVPVAWIGMPFAVSER
jgi:hypothetical protein